MNLVIFGYDACPFCRQAKKTCDNAGVVYDFVDITNPTFRPMWNEMGHNGVPVIYLNGEHMGGLRELESYIKSQRVEGTCLIM
jgi:glutaredoxin